MSSFLFFYFVLVLQCFDFVSFHSLKETKLLLDEKHMFFQISIQRKKKE